MPTSSNIMSDVKKSFTDSYIYAKNFTQLLSRSERFWDLFLTFYLLLTKKSSS